MLSLVSRAFFERTNPADQSRRRRLFVENKFAIAKSPMFENKFGRYPVIFLDLSVGQYMGCFPGYADRGKMMVRT